MDSKPHSIRCKSEGWWGQGVEDDDRYYKDGHGAWFWGDNRPTARLGIDPATAGAHLHLVHPDRPLPPARRTVGSSIGWSATLKRIPCRVTPPIRKHWQKLHPDMITLLLPLGLGDCLDLLEEQEVEDIPTLLDVLEDLAQLMPPDRYSLLTKALDRQPRELCALHPSPSLLDDVQHLPPKRSPPPETLPSRLSAPTVLVTNALARRLMGFQK